MPLTQQWLQDPLQCLGIRQMPLTQQWLHNLLEYKGDWILTNMWQCLSFKEMISLDNTRAKFSQTCGHVSLTKRRSLLMKVSFSQSCSMKWTLSHPVEKVLFEYAAQIQA
jgi:hypothetical protein